MHASSQPHGIIPGKVGGIGGADNDDVLAAARNGAAQKEMHVSPPSVSTSCSASASGAASCSACKSFDGMLDGRDPLWGYNLAMHGCPSMHTGSVSPKKSDRRTKLAQHREWTVLCLLPRHQSACSQLAVALSGRSCEKLHSGGLRVCSVMQSTHSSWDIKLEMRSGPIRVIPA